MKFYNSIGPNPHTVRMFASEKAITLPIYEVDVMNSEHRRAPYSIANPMMQTPALETDDGQTIVEITAICEYLEELNPDPLLIGSTPRERAETRMWCRRLDLNILEAKSRSGRATGGRAFYEGKIKLLSVPAALELQALVEDRILWLDGLMAGRTWICGERYTLADIMFYCFMKFELTPDAVNIPPAARDLPAWFDRVEARPSSKA